VHPHPLASPEGTLALPTDEDPVGAWVVPLLGLGLHGRIPVAGPLGLLRLRDHTMTKLKSIGMGSHGIGDILRHGWLRDLGRAKACFQCFQHMVREGALLGQLPVLLVILHAATCLLLFNIFANFIYISPFTLSW
jgi:hypothetical protein